MSVQKKIRRFISRNFLFSNPEREIANDQSFLNSGIIDSTGFLELISFLEDTFKIQIEDDELIPENLDSIDRLNKFVLKKKQHGLVTA
ncbi:acyl carrier protein [candidate division KSB1 bacterium]|nr:acyl carrier protein [candidate division KSB1 bacterium]